MTSSSAISTSTAPPGGADTYFDGPEAIHVSAAEPFSPVLRALLSEGCRALGIPVHDHGTVVVIQGPRFSTRAESRWFGVDGVGASSI